MFAIEPIYKSTMNGNYVINIGRQLGSGGKEIDPDKWLSVSVLPAADDNDRVRNNDVCRLCIR